MKKKEHLPILGIGPFLVAGMAIIAAVAIVVLYYVCKLGTLSGFSAILLCAVGIILTILFAVRCIRFTFYHTQVARQRNERISP